MEREPIPIIGLQVALIVLGFLGYIWIYEHSANIDINTFLIYLGSLSIIIGPIFSQLLFGVWKILGGFSMFDYSREFMCCVPYSKKWVVQTTFDKYWHSEEIPTHVMEYSRRRSVVCELNLFGALISILGIINFAIITIILFSENSISSWKPALLIIIFFVLAWVFWRNCKMASVELCSIQKENLKIHKEEMQREIDIKLGRIQREDINSHTEIDDILPIYLKIRKEVCGFSKIIKDALVIIEYFEKDYKKKTKKNNE